jgi:hypothetical protein
MADNDFITNTANIAYHDDTNVTAGLNARYPAPLPVAGDFPALGEQ